MRFGNTRKKLEMCNAATFRPVGCDVQTTTQLDFVRFWPLKKMAKTPEAPFFVRAGHSACVELRVSPAVKYPHIWVSVLAKIIKLRNQIFIKFTITPTKYMNTFLQSRNLPS